MTDYDHVILPLAEAGRLIGMPSEAVRSMMRRGKLERAGKDERGRSLVRFPKVWTLAARALGGEGELEARRFWSEEVDKLFDQQTAILKQLAVQAQDNREFKRALARIEAEIAVIKRRLP